jgi:hypothetical protein
MGVTRASVDSLERCTYMSAVLVLELLLESKGTWCKSRTAPQR